MRKDKREADELRPLEFKTGVNRYAEGSCLVEIGNTQVYCTVTLEEGVPRFLKGSGKGWLTAEYSMLPRSCQTRIPRDISKGKINGRSHEIQRLVGRALRSVTDLAALGERTLWIDCDVIQGDGGTRCAAISGSYVALHLAIDKLLKSKVLAKSPIKAKVAAVSVGMVDGHPALDLDYEEDSQADVDMNVIMTDAGKFVEIQGTAEKEPFSEAEMQELLTLAKHGIKQILQAQSQTLKL